MQARYSRYQVSCFLSTNAVLNITCDTVATLHFMTKLDLMHFFFLVLDKQNIAQIE